MGANFVLHAAEDLGERAELEPGEMIAMERFADEAAKLQTDERFIHLADFADLRPRGLHQLFLIALHDARAEAGDDAMDG